MQAQQRPWQLAVEAKANNFVFRLKAANTKALPTSRNLFRFSLSLKLSRLVIINVKSKPKTSIWWKPKIFFKSKFLKALDKFRIQSGFSNEEALATGRIINIRLPRWNALRGWDCGRSASTLLENLVLLLQWISEKDLSGGLLLASVSKNRVGRKLSNLLLLLMVAFFSSSILDYCLFYGCDDEGYISRYFC